jgi:hypothetical protein
LKDKNEEKGINEVLPTKSNDIQVSLLQNSSQEVGQVKTTYAGFSIREAFMSSEPNYPSQPLPFPCPTLAVPCRAVNL